MSDKAEVVHAVGVSGYIQAGVRIRGRRFTIRNTGRPSECVSDTCIAEEVVRRWNAGEPPREEHMTPQDAAVLDAAAAWRDELGEARQGFGVKAEALLTAIDAARPHVPPDPVAEALASLRTASANGYPSLVIVAAKAYLMALDAKDVAP